LDTRSSSSAWSTSGPPFTTRSARARCARTCSRRRRLPVQLTDDERAMLDGRGGKARQKAMELLVRYADAPGAERFVDTNNVAGVPGSANPFLQQYYRGKDEGGRDAIFSHFDLDADELVDVPDALVPTAHLQGGADREHWQD